MCVKILLLGFKILQTAVETEIISWDWGSGGGISF